MTPPSDLIRVKILVFLFAAMDNQKHFAYEFYRRVPCGEDRLMGVLPERRKDPKRITHNSIMNWAKLLAPEDFFKERIYFVRIESR